MSDREQCATDAPQARNARGKFQTISAGVQGVALDYAAAHRLAAVLAGQAALDEKIGEPMLVAWFDGKNRTGHPDVQECTGEAPGWRAYAASHGGRIEVNINGGEFIFIFAAGPEPAGG